VKVEPLIINDEEPLRAELSAFVDSVLGNTTPVVTARDGLLAVETADRIVTAIRAHNWNVA
jgi:predicted dehydrogenase